MYYNNVYVKTITNEASRTALFADTSDVVSVNFRR